MKKAPLLTTAAMALVLQLEAQISGPVKMTAAEFAKKISDITGSTTPKTNQNDSVAIWPHEMQEFSKHVEGAKSPRFTPEEQAENIKSLVQHWIERETEEFDRPPQNPEEVWEKVTDHKTWNDVGFLSYAKKGTNGKTVICIPQAHADEQSNEKDFEYVRKIQAEGRKIMERAHELGVETFTFEGYTQKEFDQNAPSVQYLDLKTMPALESDSIFDAEFDAQMFGLIDIKTEDSLWVVNNLYHTFLNAVEQMKWNEHNLPTLIRLMNQESQKFENLSQVNFESIVQKIFGTTKGVFNEKMDKYFSRQLDILLNQLIYDMRNRDAVKYIQTLTQSEKINALTLKYGANHFQEKYGKTLQEMLHEAGYSVIIVEIPTVNKKHPVSPKY